MRPEEEDSEFYRATFVAMLPLLSGRLEAADHAAREAVKRLRAFRDNKPAPKTPAQRIVPLAPGAGLIGSET